MPRDDYNYDEPTLLADLDSERQVLASVLVDNGIVDRLELEPEHFADKAHADAWRVAQAIVQRGDILSLAVLLAACPGAAEYLRTLPDVVTFPRQVEAYGRAVRDMAVRRQLREELATPQERLADTATPAEATIARTVDRLSRVGSGRVGATREQVALRIYEAHKRPVEVCSTGLLGLDQAMGGGLFPGKLYGIGARKKVGKTGLLGSISFNVNELEVRHLYIALEMSDVEIEQQNIARAMGFNSARFLKPDRDRLLEKVGTYVATAREKNHTLYEHVPGARFAEIRRLIARAHQRGIKGVVLDYLQLIGGRNPKETEEYHHRICAQILADIARQLGIWIVVACQLNQEGNTRGGEGLRLACDQYYVLHRDKGYPGAWLEMQDSRYTAYANVGSESSPGLWLRWNGPHFSEDPPRVNEWPSLDAEHE